VIDTAKNERLPVRVKLIKSTDGADTEVVELTPEQATQCNGAWPEFLGHNGLFYQLEDWNSNIEAVYARTTGLIL
jgi:hypothetical protein